MPKRPTFNSGSRVYTLCDTCQRLVYAEDVDDDGNCVFCEKPKIKESKQSEKKTE